MFIIEVPYFSLDQIYNSKQAPRWLKLKDNKYIVMHKDKAITVEQKRQRLILGCSEEEFYNIWFDYFDLKTDYCNLNNETKRLGGKFKRVAVRGSGIHILNQDRFEVYVFSRIVERLGWEKAKEFMNHIAQGFGIKHKQSMKEAGKVVWYEWPTVDVMLEKLSDKNEGAILKTICNDFVARESGNKIFGVLGLHRNMFPITGIESTLEKNFDCMPGDFEEWHLEGFENKGLVYLYILHHIMNPPKEVRANGFSR